MIHHGADAGSGVERVGRDPLAGMGQQSLHKLRFDAVLHQQARGGGTHLALVVEDGACGALGRGVQVRCIRQYDVGALAAALHKGALEVGLARALHQMLADFGGTGEGDAIHIHVHGQRLAYGMAKAGQHVEYAVGNTRLLGQTRDAQGGQGGLFGRLEDHRVAGGERRAQLPAGHHQREVPRHDGSDHPEWFAGHQRQCRLLDRCDLIVDLVDRFGVPGDTVGSGRSVIAHGIADGFAHVQRLQQRQLQFVETHQFGEALQDLLALFRWQAAPAFVIECGTSGLYRQLGIGGVAGGHFGQQLAVGRVDAVEGGAIDGIPIAAIDKGLRGQGQVGGLVLPLGQGQVTHVHSLNRQKVTIRVSIC